MYTLIAKWYIQADDNDKAKAVLQALRELAAQVEAQEPDTWMYLVHTGNQEGSTPPPAPAPRKSQGRAASAPRARRAGGSAGARHVDVPGAHRQPGGLDSASRARRGRFRGGL